MEKERIILATMAMEMEMAGMMMVKGGTMRKTKWMMSLSKRWKQHVKREKWRKRSHKCE